MVSAAKDGTMSSGTRANARMLDIVPSSTRTAGLGTALQLQQECVIPDRPRLEIEPEWRSTSLGMSSHVIYDIRSADMRSRFVEGLPWPIPIRIIVMRIY